MKSVHRFLLALSALAFFGCFGSSLQGEGAGGAGGDGDGDAASGGGGVGGGSGTWGGAGGNGDTGSGVAGAFGGGDPGFSGGGAGGIGGIGGGFAGGPGGGFFPGMPIGPGGPGVPGMPIDLGECRDEGGSRDRNYCERQLQCDGGFAYIWCEFQGDGWWCGCDSGYSSMQFSLQGDVVDACAQITDVCTGAVVPEPSAPETCSTSYTDSGPDYCSTERECRQTLDAGDGLSLDTIQWRSSYCNLAPSGWICECYDGYYNMRVELPSDQGNPAVCNTVMDACSGNAITLVGEAQCAPRSLFTDRSFCDVQLECSQDALLDGLSVSVFQYRQANCEFVGDSIWNCQCNGAEVSQSFQMDGDDAWDTCTRAGDRCAGL